MSSTFCIHQQERRWRGRAELTRKVRQSSFAAGLDEASTGVGCTSRGSCTDSAASEILADERCGHGGRVLDVMVEC